MFAETGLERERERLEKMLEEREPTFAGSLAFSAKLCVIPSVMSIVIVYVIGIIAAHTRAHSEREYQV